jgi:hypothetical protein
MNRMRTRIALVAGLLLALSTAVTVVGKDHSETQVFTTFGDSSNADSHVPEMFSGFDPLLCNKGTTELVEGGGWSLPGGRFAFDATIRVTCKDGTGTFAYQMVGEGPPTAFDWLIVADSGTGDYVGLAGGGTGYNSHSYNMGEGQVGHDYFLGEITLEP